MKNKGRVAFGKKIALERWGQGYKLRAFPQINGKFKVTLEKINGDKKWKFIGTDRTKLLLQAVQTLENNLDA